MKRVTALTVLSLMGLAPISSTDAQVTGKIFRVKVKSSFAPSFTDCFRFDVPGTGDLSIDRLGQAITYRHGQLDTVGTEFKAVSMSGQLLSIMFYGEELEALERLTGQAVNEFGDTFEFSGLETATCVAAAAASSGTSPYRR
jgi:hypothetical protein